MMSKHPSAILATSCFSVLLFKRKKKLFLLISFLNGFMASPGLLRSDARRVHGNTKTN